MGSQENKAVGKVQDDASKLESSSMESINDISLQSKNQDIEKQIKTGKEFSGEATSVENDKPNLADFVKSTLQEEKESLCEAQSLFDIVKSSQKEGAEETKTPEKESLS